MRRLATLLVLSVLGLGAGDALAARGTPAKGRMPVAAKRMAVKLAQRAMGANKERPRNTTKRKQRGLQRALSRRDTGLGGSESKRAREQIARGIGDGDSRPKQTLKWRRR
ncbi:MAG TPA: hypothetical protein VMZ28_21700 [Kofleriaceae bacterium]|nr:hypothetical protein [Kofleriaceae bacterium]